jgi:integrase
VIRLDDRRHTAATLMLEAGIDVKVVSDTLGHANVRITMDLYQHVRQQVHVDAAERVVELLASSGSLT